MTHLKTAFAITLLICFFSLKTNAQVGVNIDSIRKCLSISQQSFGIKPPPNSFSNKPVSCVFAINSFKENAQITHNTAISPVDANKTLFRKDKNPPVQNTYILRDPFEIITDKNATVVERIVGALLLFSYL
jgi:hypothetical protein